MALVDALVLTFGVGLLTWVLTVEARFQQPDTGFTADFLLIAYPLADIIVLGLVVRLVTAVRFSPAVLLLVLGTLGYVVGDALFRVGRIDEDWPVGTPLDLGYFALYAFWGAAALVPSMRRITERRLPRPRETTVLRLVLLGLSALIPPGILLFESVAVGGIRHGAVIAVASLVIFLLVLMRLAYLAQRLREQVGRERGLREVTERAGRGRRRCGHRRRAGRRDPRVLGPAGPVPFPAATQRPRRPTPGRHWASVPAETAREAIARLDEPTLCHSATCCGADRRRARRPPRPRRARHRPETITVALPLSVGDGGEDTHRRPAGRRRGASRWSWPRTGSRCSPRRRRWPSSGSRSARR